MTIPFDAKAHFQAQIQFLASALHSGQSPFWTPNVFGGSPHVADPQSLIFSPALILAALNPAPSFRAVDAYVLLLLLTGAGGVLLLFRDRGWHPAGAVAAAIAFAFGASAAWRIQHIGQIESFAFFAVTLWALLGAIQRRSFLWAAGAGLSAAFMFVEPDQIAFLGLILLGCIGLCSVVGAWREGVPADRLIGMIAVAGVVFVAVVALPITWTYLFAESSNRPEVTFAEAARASLHPAALLTAILGDIFGAGDPKVDFWGPLGSDWSGKNLALSQNMVQLYAGALPALAVVVLGVSRGFLWERGVRPLTTALVFSIVYALGSATPVFKLLFDYLPGVSAFRRPADATFLIGGLGAILAGYVVHRLASGGLAKADIGRLVLKITALLALFVLTLGLAVASRKLDVAIRPLLNAVFWLSAAALVLAAVTRFGKARPWLAASLVSALMVADLSANNGPNISTALPPKVYEVMDPNCGNETIKLIKRLTKMQPGSTRRDRVELAGIGFEWPNLGMIHGFDHTLGYNPLRIGEFNDAVGAVDTIAGIDQKRFTAVYPSYRSTFANMLGLRYIAMPVPIEQVDKAVRPGAFPLVARTKDAYVYENTEALPRVMFVTGWRTVDFETVLEEGLPANFDPTRTVLIEQQIEEGEGPSAVAGVSKARVSMPVYANTEIIVEVEAERAGFLVLNDVWHPWWKATVDGEDAEIVKANLIFRAVQIPAGKHVIRFDFRPVEGAITEIREKIEEKIEEKNEADENRDAAEGTDGKATN